MLHLSRANVPFRSIRFTGYSQRRHGFNSEQVHQFLLFIFVKFNQIELHHCTWCEIIFWQSCNCCRNRGLTLPFKGLVTDFRQPDLFSLRAEIEPAGYRPTLPFFQRPISYRREVWPCYLTPLIGVLKHCVCNYRCWVLQSLPYCRCAVKKAMVKMA